VRSAASAVDLTPGMTTAMPTSNPAATITPRSRRDQGAGISNKSGHLNSYGGGSRAVGRGLIRKDCRPRSGRHLRAGGREPATRGRTRVGRRSRASGDGHPRLGERESARAVHLDHWNKPTDLDRARARVPARERECQGRRRGALAGRQRASGSASRRGHRGRRRQGWRRR